MSKLDDNVNAILGIETLRHTTGSVSNFEPPHEMVEVKRNLPRPVEEHNKDIDHDYDYARDNYYGLIEKGNDAIQGILDIAKEGQHPRAYEVAGQLIQQVGQTVDKLQDLQKKLKDLKEVPGKVNPTIKNALFVGSTAELQKMLNRKSEDEIIESEAVNTEKDKPGNK